MKTLLTLLAALTLSQGAAADASASLEAAIHGLQQEWAIANYKTPKDRQDEVFSGLTQKAEAVVRRYPGRAEPLVWQAIIVSSHAGATGGLGALGKVKTARSLLETAEKIDPTTLSGSIYTSLGSLYYQVPGWPIGFGSDRKADEYLRKALSMNPQGIDPNYFYGDFLLNQKRYAESVSYLNKALSAPARPDRPLADEGRREEAQQALKIAKAKLDH